MTSRLPPVVGWKLATWRMSGDGVVFTGLAGGSYRAVDVSRCPSGCPASVPRSEAHRCGFHAWRDRRRSFSPDPGRVQLRVALGGIVREYRDGYRAGRQRVLAVHVPPVCLRCADLAAALLDPSLAPVCAPCAFTAHEDALSMDAVRYRIGLAVWWLSSALALQPARR